MIGAREGVDKYLCTENEASGEEDHHVDSERHLHTQKRQEQRCSREPHDGCGTRADLVRDAPGDQQPDDGAGIEETRKRFVEESMRRLDLSPEQRRVYLDAFEDGRRGFFILADRADPARKNYASGEELLDPECAKPE